METPKDINPKVTLSNENFQEDSRDDIVLSRDDTDILLLNIDGYEGPIEVLLDLARNQKVDLLNISILQLVRQYLDFIERAKQLKLSIAAEYLVMASWLTYMKSKLLLPKEGDDEDEVSGEEMAEALQFQLQRLNAMQEAGDKLLEGNVLGQKIFSRGMVEDLPVNDNVKYKVGLFDILDAYGKIQRRKEHTEYSLEEFDLMSMDEASERLSKMLGGLPRNSSNSSKSVWATLDSFLPENIINPLYGRSSVASLFTAGLEMVKQGRADVRQDGLFRPVYMRSAVREDSR